MVTQRKVLDVITIALAFVTLVSPVVSCVGRNFQKAAIAQQEHDRIEQSQRAAANYRPHPGDRIPPAAVNMFNDLGINHAPAAQPSNADLAAAAPQTAHPAERPATAQH